MPIRSGLFLKEWRWLAFWLIAGAIVRLAPIILDGSRLWLESDDEAYFRSAAMLVETGTFSYSAHNLPTVFIMPLYPALLAAVVSLFGNGEWGALASRLSGVILSLATITLLHHMVSQQFDRKTAVFTAAIWAIYPPAILVSGLLLTETLYTFLTVLFFYSLQMASTGVSTQQRFRWELLSGFTLGFMTLTRPVSALLPFVAAAALSFSHGWRKGLRYGASALIIVGLVMTPWIVRNYIHFDRVIPLTLASGNPFLTGTYYDVNIWVNGRDPEFPDWPLGWKRVPGDEIATDEILMNTGIERLLSLWGQEPEKVLHWYTVGKLKYMWWDHLSMWKSIELPYLPIEPSLVLHRLLLLLAAGGLMIALRQKRAEALLFIFAALYFTAIHLVYTPLPRYVFPLLPLLFSLSAYFLERSLETVSEFLIRLRRRPPTPT
ncbi:hypothetical protein GTO91_16990 [Heliobacterium undosum]|uniref:Glycosyltransferase RgtA/B/C/D-like domain-containing protein n=1 Tax=Heliomicrobium undosum TaxID=121734 RepID=A0A845L516_9FIRM|nr:glycosyltransferase family 39 protein [Heliomicrobium undosum]MZP31393.1 hypothetical protein [Heliomicrobium undosum]